MEDLEIAKLAVTNPRHLRPGSEDGLRIVDEMLAIGWMMRNGAFDEKGARETGREAIDAVGGIHTTFVAGGSGEVWRIPPDAVQDQDDDSK